MIDKLTHPFDEVVQDRVRREPAFGAGLLEAAAQCMLDGELAAARNLVRNVIKGSIGYADLSRRTGTPEKSLVRMFGPGGNPTAANLSRIFAHLQRHEGVTLEVRSIPATAGKTTKRTSSARRVA